MKFETAFNCGDKGWIFYGRYGSHVQQATIGQIRVEYTNCYVCDDGMKCRRPPTLIQEMKEVYMCEETGIGTGTLLTYGEHIFKTKEECEAKFADVIAKQKQEKLDKVENEKKHKLGQEAILRLQLAEIEKIKGEM